jgi:hypothetical protein
VPDTESSVLIIKIDGRDFQVEIRQDPSLGFTPREWGTLDRVAGVAGAADFGRRLRAGNMLLIATVAIVLLQRAGQPVDEDAMLDGKYILEVRAGEVDADPPTGGAQASDPAQRSRTTKARARTGSRA